MCRKGALTCGEKFLTRRTRTGGGAKLKQQVGECIGVVSTRMVHTPDGGDGEEGRRGEDSGANELMHTASLPPGRHAVWCFSSSRLPPRASPTAPRVIRRPRRYIAGMARAPQHRRIEWCYGHIWHYFLAVTLDVAQASACTEVALTRLPRDRETADVLGIAECCRAVVRELAPTEPRTMGEISCQQDAARAAYNAELCAALDRAAFDAGIPRHDPLRARLRAQMAAPAPDAAERVACARECEARGVELPEPNPWRGLSTYTPDEREQCARDAFFGLPAEGRIAVHPTRARALARIDVSPDDCEARVNPDRGLQAAVEALWAASPSPPEHLRAPSGRRPHARVAPFGNGLRTQALLLATTPAAILFAAGVVAASLAQLVCLALGIASWTTCLFALACAMSVASFAYLWLPTRSITRLRRRLFHLDRTAGPHAGVLGCEWPAVMVDGDEVAGNALISAPPAPRPEPRGDPEAQLAPRRR